jgi:hypothetical protein
MSLLRRYFYWTYERGSFHYDVMVTFIIAFILVTPHLWDYKDSPARYMPLQSSQVLVKTLDQGSFEVQIPVSALHGAATPDAQHEAMLRVIQPIAGNVEIIGTPKPNLDPNGHIVGYTVRATR